MGLTNILAASRRTSWLLLMTAGLFAGCTYFEHRNKVEAAIEAYMVQQDPSYEPIAFSRFYEQEHAQGIERLLGTTETVKFTMVHTYSLEGQIFTDAYFHLNADLRVLGYLSEEQMMELTLEALEKQGILDSLGIERPDA